MTASILGFATASNTTKNYLKRGLSDLYYERGSKRIHASFPSETGSTVTPHSTLSQSYSTHAAGGGLTYSQGLTSSYLYTNLPYFTSMPLQV